MAQYMKQRISWLLAAALAAGTACSPQLDDPSDPALQEEPGDATSESSLASIWRPAPRTTWQWQLTGPLDPSFNVQMYDLDLFNTSTAEIDALKARGRAVICYLSAGTYESWRPDARRYPASALGQSVEGWAGERWVDIRDAAVRDILRARLDLAVQKHCAGVEPDNVDGYANATGFPLGAADQLTFNRWLAAEAHARGLSVGLKNDLNQVSQLVSAFDWALDEECVKYDECGTLAPFIRAGKAVFHVEYEGTLSRICATTRPLGFSTLMKNLDVSSVYQPCP